MSAICHNCGAHKFDPFQSCPHCNKVPQSDDEVALVMMLSGDFLPLEKLAAAAAVIKSGQRLELPPKMRSWVLSVRNRWMRRGGGGRLI